MSSPPAYHFVRHSRLSSKVFVQRDGVDQYCFAADSSKEAKVCMYGGASTANEALGCLTFPKTHNAFRMHYANINNSDDEKSEKSEKHSHGLDTSSTDVQAAIGYPHPKTFSFKILDGSSAKTRDFVWTYKTGDLDESPPVRYDLHAQNPQGTHLATLTVTKKGKEGTTVRWNVESKSEQEQAIIILSAIGIITRLSRKGKLHDGSSSLQRWNNFWWMAALSTAAIA